MLVMALVLQNFDMKLEDPTYEMTTEQVDRVVGAVREALRR